jgi:hypothetical protein
MSQNYRILQHEEDENGRPVFGIHATFCDEEGAIQGWGDDPILVAGSVEDLLTELEHLRDAAFKPIIDLREERWAKERPTGTHERL